MERFFGLMSWKFHDSYSLLSGKSFITIKILPDSNSKEYICERSGIAVFGGFFGSTGIRRIEAECNVFLVLWDVVGLDD